MSAMLMVEMQWLVESTLPIVPYYIEHKDFTIHLAQWQGLWEDMSVRY